MNMTQQQARRACIVSAIYYCGAIENSADNNARTFAILAVENAGRVFFVREELPNAAGGVANMLTEAVSGISRSPNAKPVDVESLLGAAFLGDVKSTETFAIVTRAERWPGPPRVSSTHLVLTNRDGTLGGTEEKPVRAGGDCVLPKQQDYPTPPVPSAPLKVWKIQDIKSKSDLDSSSLPACVRELSKRSRYYLALNQK